MTPRKVRADAMRRASEAWQLRVAGRTWEQVAAAVGYTDAANCVRAVRTYFGTLPAPARDELRELARARGEALWSQAFQDALERRPGAVRAAVALLQRQAALDGLDEPSRAHVEVTGAEFDELVARLSGILAPQAIEADITEEWIVEPDD